uniref:Uncharacterized protein n=1 Tax=Knipowitschia caucasica TaxID=637954 RepID=A0AAV2LYH8_KNICA
MLNSQSPMRQAHRLMPSLCPHMFEQSLRADWFGQYQSARSEAESPYPLIRSQSLTVQNPEGCVIFDKRLVGEEARLKWMSRMNKDMVGNESGFRVKEHIACNVALNVCSCTADEKRGWVPFSNLIFPRVWAHNLHTAFLETHPDPEAIQFHRAQEYSRFLKR